MAIARLANPGACGFHYGVENPGCRDGSRYALSPHLARPADDQRNVHQLAIDAEGVADVLAFAQHLAVISDQDDQSVVPLLGTVEHVQELGQQMVLVGDLGVIHVAQGAGLQFGEGPGCRREPPYRPPVKVVHKAVRCIVLAQEGGKSLHESLRRRVGQVRLHQIDEAKVGLFPRCESLAHKPRGVADRARGVALEAREPGPQRNPEGVESSLKDLAVAAKGILDGSDDPP